MARNLENFVIVILLVFEVYGLFNYMTNDLEQVQILILPT